METKKRIRQMIRTESNKIRDSEIDDGELWIQFAPNITIYDLFAVMIIAEEHGHYMSYGGSESESNEVCIKEIQE